jgi:4-hydroxy 2-oxovalerate aldolase
MSLQPSRNVTILDCTLRDGGYCNNWQFDKKTAFAIISALSNAGVDIIELGYKSPFIHTEKTFEGLFRYCTESQLKTLPTTKGVSYAFMIDAKEFISGEDVDADRVRNTIPPHNESVFDWARVATYAQNFSAVVSLIKILKKMGYHVSLNLMGTSLLTREEFSHAIQQFTQADMDVLFFSDSFGDLTPVDVLNCIDVIRFFFKGNIGIHTHDNNGLAFANTLCAIDAGVDFVDCTISGMGRGAGNLRTEQLLLYLYFKKKYIHLNPSELLDIINSHLTPLKEKFRWGWDYTYMLSSLQNIHPTYCMNLRASNQYSIEQVSAILNGITPDKRKKYNEAALLDAIDTVVNEPLVQDGPLVNIPHYSPKHSESVLVLGTGPSADNYADEIIEFIQQKNPFVIECNPRHERFDNATDNYLIAILNWVRLKKRLDNYHSSKKPLVTGIAALPKQYTGQSHIFSLPCHVEKGEIVINKDRITLPAYVVGMFSVGLALLSSPKTVYLAGFDGFPNGTHPQQQDMIRFFENLTERKQTHLISITPSTYPIEIEPVYKFIK